MSHETDSSSDGKGFHSREGVHKTPYGALNSIETFSQGGVCGDLFIFSESHDKQKHWSTEASISSHDLPDEPQPRGANTVDAITEKTAKRTEARDLRPISRWRWGEKKRAKKTRSTQEKLQADALTQPVWYWFISQPWAPEWMPYWAHLRKNLYLHSPNWEPPLSHERHRSDVSTVTVTHNKDIYIYIRYTCDARAMSVCCDVRKIKGRVRKRAEALSYSLLQKSCVQYLLLWEFIVNV